MTEPAARSPAAWIVAATALIAVLVMTTSALSAADWDPTVFVGFGEEAAITTDYAEERLGNVRLRPSQGHDGKYFFVQANDPLLLNPEANAAILDLPMYRSQRMLYPLLAGGFGLVPAGAVVWTLLIVNLVAIALGTLATARLATLFDRSPWWGMAFAGNIGLLYALTSDGSDVVAAALVMWALYFLDRDRVAGAIVMLTAAALSREVMLVCAAGAAAWLWLAGRRRHAILTAAVPGLVFGAWTVYLLNRLGPDETSARAIGLPFVGLSQAFGSWVEEPIALAAGMGVIALLVLFTMRWSTSRTPLGWTCIGFVPLAVILSEKVWREVFDFTRAIAPLMTVAVLLIFVETRRHQHSTAPNTFVEASP